MLNHAGKCKHAHGHRYKFEITCEADTLDDVGRVIDFSVIKRLVGGWLDEQWDHGFIVQKEDPIATFLAAEGSKVFLVSFSPTAEHLATYLLSMANSLLKHSNVRVVKVRCWETPNCYADAEVVS